MRDIVLPVIYVLLVVAVIIQGFMLNESFKMIEDERESVEEYQELTQQAQDRTEEALEMIDMWKTGYKELQEEHSQALEHIEQLEYEMEWRE